MSPTGTTATGRADRPRLTELQRKKNHTDSEQRRREVIRAAYDRLAEIVPGMAGHGRSEAAVLAAAVTEIRRQILRRVEIIEAMKEAGEDTGHLELPKDVVEAALAMEEEDPLTPQEGGAK
ncbi:uncharacterized protein EI97DRAFT_375640 [Westerdykella ornata]|uniref:BHLH domain-containing protein n=1 Tax=Westerdykella ornata TaxID=318751 RepID=A0A6A6JKA2_WESOR|nr:uncharacterized protein EI97DRAFT_375640 [Westerdykella ornata]KAF2276937.1 hypothetical protein EI97DRAFT_375640 [Westerdykella ornata]